MGVSRGLGRTGARYERARVNRVAEVKSSKAKGNANQIQYNASGSFQGATFLYDSSTGYIGAGFTALNDITHRITLPNSSGAGGAIKARTYTTYSSSRFKSDVETIQNPIMLIERMRGVTYNKLDTGVKEYGFIAEEIGQVTPSMVQWESDGQNAQGLDYTRLVPILLEGIKSQQRQIEDQQRQIYFLLNKFNELSNIIYNDHLTLERNVAS